MRIYDITAEAFGDPVFVDGFLKIQDYVDISTSKATSASRAKWESAIDKMQYGTKIYDARIYSAELIWNDWKQEPVPVGWPDSTITPEGESERQKYFGEYTFLQRSDVDNTKCIMRFGKFRTFTIVDGKYTQMTFMPLESAILTLYLDLFVGVYFTKIEYDAWVAANITPTP